MPVTDSSSLTDKYTNTTMCVSGSQASHPLLTAFTQKITPTAAITCTHTRKYTNTETHYYAVFGVQKIDHTQLNFSTSVIKSCMSVCV